MGGAKIPGLLVSSPKGTSRKDKEKENQGPDVAWTLTLRGRGQKRIRYEGDNTGKELEEDTNDGTYNETKDEWDAVRCTKPDQLVPNRDETWYLWTGVTGQEWVPDSSPEVVPGNL